MLLSRDEMTAMFAETRPEAIEDMRAAADELRAELAGDTVTFVVNRNINVSNVCVVGCAFCGFGQGKRSPDAYEHSREEFATRVQDALDFGATEICMQSGIHPDWGLEDYEGWLRYAKELAPDIHMHAYSPMEISHMCDVSGLSPRAVFARLREAGLDSTPGTAAEVLHDGVRQRISPNKLPVARWVEIIEASHREGLRSTVTVMFGHIEEPDELAEHMRVVRELQARTGGFTEFVPLSFIPFHTLLGRTHGIEEISREENLKHTAAFRLALGPQRAEPAGELGEDGARRRHRGAALGRQRPRRDADGGVDLAHGRLLPRGPPRTVGPDRRGARRGAPGGRAHDALRHPRALRAGGCCVTELVLGPALRYAGETQALIWVETDGPCTVSVLELRVEDVLRRGAPLRARGLRGARARDDHALRGRARRQDGVAAAGQRLSAERRPHPRPGAADADRVRLLPRVRAARAAALAAARTSTPTGARSTRCGRSPSGWPSSTRRSGRRR